MGRPRYDLESPLPSGQRADHRTLQARKGGAAPRPRAPKKAAPASGKAEGGEAQKGAKLPVLAGTGAYQAQQPSSARGGAWGAGVGGAWGYFPGGQQGVEQYFAQQQQQLAVLQNNWQVRPWSR